MGLVQRRRQAKGFGWKGRGEGSAGSRVGEEICKGQGSEALETGGETCPGEGDGPWGSCWGVKPRGHPGIPHLIPPSAADHGRSVDTSCACRRIPSRSAHHAGSHCLRGFMPLGSNRGAQLKPQLLSSAEITLGHILYIPGGGAKEGANPRCPRPGALSRPPSSDLTTASRASSQVNSLHPSPGLCSAEPQLRPP